MWPGEIKCCFLGAVQLIDKKKVKNLYVGNAKYLIKPLKT